MLLASGQRLTGLARRSSFDAIQPIEPCQPWARKSRRWPAAPGKSVALAKRTTSKPSDCARARMVSRMSEVEFCIVHHRRLAGHAVAEQSTKRGTRLDADVPLAGERKLRPGNLAEIVERRESGGDCEIAKGAIARCEVAFRRDRGCDG